MRQFYLGKTSSGYYKAYFIDPVTGIRDYGKSTGTKDKLEAAVIANEWHTIRHDQCLLKFQFLRMKGATPFIPMIGPRVETGRTQSGTLLRNEVKQMRGATGLTVLALFLRASLPCAATFLENGTYGTRRNVVSGNGTKYGWSERLF